MQHQFSSEKLNENGRRAIYIFIYFIFYILFTIKTMDKVLETSGSQCHIPSSKPFRIQLNEHKMLQITTIYLIYSNSKRYNA
jgi:hypothetical protein